MLSLVQFCYGYAGPNLPRMEDWGLLKLRLVTSPVENYLPLCNAELRTYVRTRRKSLMCKNMLKNGKNKEDYPPPS